MAAAVAATVATAATAVTAAAAAALTAAEERIQSSMSLMQFIGRSVL